MPKRLSSSILRRRIARVGRELIDDLDALKRLESWDNDDDGLFDAVISLGVVVREFEDEE